MSLLKEAILTNNPSLLLKGTGKTKEYIMDAVKTGSCQRVLTDCSGVECACCPLKSTDRLNKWFELLKEDFVVGRWYKFEDFYAKFLKIDGFNFHCSAYIWKEQYFSSGGSLTSELRELTLADMSEVSKLLPVGHVDKAKLIPGTRIKPDDMIPGEVYKYSDFLFIFKEKEGRRYRFISQINYIGSSWQATDSWACTSYDVYVATTEEKEWVMVCHRNGGFVPQSSLERVSATQKMQAEARLERLPSSWIVAVTTENADILNDWKHKVSDGKCSDKASRYPYICNEGYGKNSVDGLTIISFEDFKKYVLKKNVPELDEFRFTKSNMVTGEYYYSPQRGHQVSNVVKRLGFDNFCTILVENCIFESSAGTLVNGPFRKATTEERQWLDVCALEGKFVAKESVPGLVLHHCTATPSILGIPFSITGLSEQPLLAGPGILSKVVFNSSEEDDMPTIQLNAVKSVIFPD